MDESQRRQRVERAQREFDRAVVELRQAQNHYMMERSRPRSLENAQRLAKIERDVQAAKDRVEQARWGLDKAKSGR